MKEKALLQLNVVQDQKNSSDEREGSTHSQVTIASSSIVIKSFLLMLSMCFYIVQFGHKPKLSVMLCRISGKI